MSLDRFTLSATSERFFRHWRAGIVSRQTLCHKQRCDADGRWQHARVIPRRRSAGLKIPTRTRLYPYKISRKSAEWYKDEKTFVFIYFTRHVCVFSSLLPSLLGSRLAPKIKLSSLQFRYCATTRVHSAAQIFIQVGGRLQTTI